MRFRPSNPLRIIPMIRLSYLNIVKKQITSFVAGIFCILTISCGSDVTTVDHTLPDHFRLLTQVGETTQHLKIDYINSGLQVKVAEGDLASTIDDEAGWRFRGETDYTLSSINRWLEGINRLAVPEDGANLIPILADSGLNNSSVQWQLVPMPEGGCVIYNELLGSELALTIDTSTQPFGVSMMSIDSEQEGQRWRLDPFGDVDGALAERCR